MDEQEMIRFLRSELYQAMERDPELRAALKHIDAGKGTFQDTAQYSERTSELLGRILSKHVDELPEGMRETVCKALLRERYEEVNGICAEVQEQLDAQNGIRLQPQRAPYPAERVQQVAHALEDPTVALSVIQRRAKAPVANVSKSFHDDYIRENASVRTDLGFKCYLDRIAAPGCCKWCTGVAGRYVYGDHPDDIFHRHDNCACTVTFENGRERQDVWSKRTWDAHDPKEIERLASRETVYTEEQAREIEIEQLEFMSNSFRPTYSDHQTTLALGSVRIPTYKVQNSEFDIYTDTPDRKNKAVRTVEKLLRNIQQDLPDGFELPPFYLIDFEEYGLNIGKNGKVLDAIGGYYDRLGIVCFNSKYNTPQKIIEYVTRNPGRFANQTEYAPVLHELGHKFYEDSVKRLAISGEMSYNEAKDLIDYRIFEYIKARNTNGRFVLNNISSYADDGYSGHSYTEIIAECFSVAKTNPIANELLALLMG